MKKSLGAVLALVVCLGMTGCVSSLFGPGKDPQMVAHRGAGDLTMPEASLPAYSNAVEQAMDIVKLDLQKTKDGVIVMSHDPTLARLMGWPVAFKDVTYAEIVEKGRFLGKKKKPTDLTIVRLDEALAIVKPLPEFWIDFKHFDPDFAERVLAEFDKVGIARSRIMVATFSVPALKYFQAKHPEIRRVGHIGAQKGEELYAYCEELGLWGVNMPVLQKLQRQTTREEIRELKKRGLWVSLWFVQNRKMEELYRGAGMDAYVTDHVSRVRLANLDAE